MKYLEIELLIPVAIVLLQTGIIISLWIGFLKWKNVLRSPLGGLDNESTAVAIGVLAGAAIISLSGIEDIFQAFKTYQASGDSVFSNTLYKASELFVIIILFQVLYGIILMVLMKMLRINFRDGAEAETSLPVSLLLGVIMVIIGFVLFFCAGEITEYSVPGYINLR